MTDETPTHRRVMEKARAEIERLTRELAEVRLHAKVHQAELVDALRQATDERDAALRDNAALRAMMPSEDEAEGLRAIRTARFCGGPSEVYAKAALYLDRLSPLLTNSIDRTEEDRNV